MRRDYGKLLKVHGDKKVVNIKVGKMSYRELNYTIYRYMREEHTHFYLESVMGQRYIGAGLGHEVEVDINGIPGQDLGVFNGGARLTVYGNAQDGVGNTMNDGFIVVHGNVGDIPGHMMRNGKIYIRGSAGFRAGIMMKEYGRKHPVMIVGERIGDYAGEYMAGGTIIVLGCGMPDGVSPVGRYVGSGIFGGSIWVRGSIEEGQLGNGAVCVSAKKEDLETIRQYLEEFAEIFNLSYNEIVSYPFWKIQRAAERPYGKLYVPSSKIGGELYPLHLDLQSPCAKACPIGIPNPVIIRKLKEGKLQETFELIDDYTPFRYSCCGIACPGFCKTSCTRGLVDEPVAIDEIARTYAPQGPVKIKGKPKNERIAIIGGGPSGLSAAWQLARRGYGVDVYEKERELGGKLVYNVPEKRLPQSIIAREIERIRSLGITFFMETEVDAEKFHTMRESYDAIIVAVGAQKPRQLGFYGEENAVTSYEFLRSFKRGTRSNNLNVEGKDVVILGAGNVGMDVACECFDHGAQSVTAIDVQPPAAFGVELSRAEERGTQILFPRTIARYENGIVYFQNGDSLKADVLIESVGEISELRFIDQEILIDKKSFTTNIPRVYIIGDAVMPGLFAHAIAAGKKVAEEVHRIFRGEQREGFPYLEDERPGVDKHHINLVYFQKKDNFYNRSIDACISCGTCIQCDICVENCPHEAVTRIGESFEIELDLCTGCGACASLCPRGAIIMVKKSDIVWEGNTETTKVTPKAHSLTREK